MTNGIERFIARLLIVILSLQPTLLYADNIQVVGPDNGPRPHADQSYNGTRVLNIATPKGGTSHNIYSDFVADDLILNNSATNVDTQLGGWIEGNPNLTPGNEANLWIGEVVGGNQTRLNGILEVGGKTMDVILANEFGITCNGCGFINTNRATLTTGKPVFAPNGALQSLDVKRGLVEIGPNGLNPESRLSLSDTGRVDVIARAAALYGKMRGSELNIVAGANKVDYNWSYDPETGAVTGITEQSGSGAAPAFAVDVAALGGMYANAIKLVATENGVGVRLNGELASAGNISLRADGQLRLGAPSAGHVPKIKAKKKIRIRNNGPILLEGSLVSEDNDLVDVRTSSGGLTFTGEAQGGNVTLESAGLADIRASVTAQGALRISSLANDVSIGTQAELSAQTMDIDAAVNAILNGKLSAINSLDIDAVTSINAAAGSSLTGDDIQLDAQTVLASGLITADDNLAITAGAGGVSTSGTLSARTLSIVSGGTVINSGTLSAGDSLTVEAVTSITNAAVMISGNDLALYSDQILNNGGVIWANDSVTLAANADLDSASLVQNTNGRIEAFQGDLTIRADAVDNIGIAPSSVTSEIIKWVEEGSGEPIIPSTEILKLVKPEYLGSDGKILAAHYPAYLALWVDLISGADTLSAEAQALLKSTVTTPSGTALESELKTLWSNMFAKANEAGTTDPAAKVKDMVDPAIFDADGNVLPAHEAAYVDLWETLAAGNTVVSDDVKAILKPGSLTTEEVTDPDTSITTTVTTNTLTSESTNVWAAMISGSDASYDIVKILYQDKFSNDGKLAELVAGKDIDIKAEKLRNIFGTVSAGGDILITANEVENKALGATQVLLEVHKKPGCFTCHEGETDFYDTFGGRIEAVGNVTIVGSLANETVRSSEMSIQDVMNEMNAYIAEQQAEGDSSLAGVPGLRSNNFHLDDHRTDAYTEPVSGNGDDIRKIIPVDTDKAIDVAVAPTVTPGVTPTAPVDALLAAGLNTIAERNPEFTDYANFITSNYMMDVDRLQYRDSLINNTHENNDAVIGSGDGSPVKLGPISWLNKPVQVPAPDGSGLRTIYPSASSLELDPRGAVIKGENVSVTGADIDNSGQILASNNASLTASGSITGRDGKVSADTGLAAITALGRIDFEETKIEANEVDIIAGQDFVGKGLAISSESDTSIFAAADVTLTALEKNYTVNSPSTRVIPGKDGEPAKVVNTGGGRQVSIREQKISTLDVGGDLSIVTSGDLVLAGLKGKIDGKTSLSAGGDLLLAAVQSETKIKAGNTRIHQVTSHTTSLESGGDFVANAGGKAILVGTDIDSGGKVQLAAADDVVLAASQDIYTYDYRKKKGGFFYKKETVVSKTRVTNKGTSIAALGDVDIISQTGDLTTAGTRFASGQGDVNLSAIEGDIYAGVYTDIFRSYSKTSKSILGGLLDSTRIANSVDRINTGTAALAALDLSFVSGDDTTLIGAQLSAGRQLSIKTGGDFSVQAAIDSQRRDFFSHETGLVLMTTITEKSYVETAVLTRFLAGQGMAFDIGGEAALTLYNYAGVDAQTAQDLYPEELLAIEGLKLLNQQLADDYFYDEKVALSPAFKALVSVAVGAFVAPYLVGAMFPALAAAEAGTLLSALGSGLEAFTASALVNGLDMAISGDFDLGELLKGAAFSGVTAGLTSGINLSTFGITPESNPDLFQGLLGTFGNNKLSLGNILDGALDGAIRSGLSSAVYGTDFGEGFSQSLIRTVVNLALTDAQFEIGELGFAEGSPPHMLLHGIAGCAAAAASGNSCAAGAAGAVAQSVFAGVLSGTDLKPETATKLSRMLGALAGFALSEGKAENVNIAADIAQSAFENNYLKHTDIAELSEEIKQCKAKQGGCTTEEQREIALKYVHRAVGNDKELAQSCYTDECVNSFLQNAAKYGDVIAEISRQSPLIATYLARSGSFFVSGPAQRQLAVNIDYAKGYLDYQQTKCSGLSAIQCQADYAVAYQDYQEDMVLVQKAKLVLALATGALPAGASALLSMRTCLSNPVCINEMAILAAEVAAGDALTGNSLSMSVHTGGKVVMKAGDQIVGLIDDAGRVLARVDDVAGNALVFRNTDGSLLRLNNTGDLVATNRIVPDEILDQADLDRFVTLRNDLGITSNNQLRRNVAVGEGNVDGVDIGEIIGVSGKRGPGVDMPENPIFTTTTVGHPRNLDSEVFVLENLAQRLTPQSTGTVRLLSERTVCSSCQGVITQFREKFPNINLIVRAGSQ